MIQEDLTRQRVRLLLLPQLSARTTTAHALSSGRLCPFLPSKTQGITKPTVRRLARRGDVKRISGLTYEETRGILKIG
jgi:hypothetical protein